MEFCLMSKICVRLVLSLNVMSSCLSAAGCGSGEYRFGELTRLADKYKTDKGSLLHHYTEVYEGFFYPMKDSARKICEIGVLEGASLKMFEDYFGRAVIYGIDIQDTSRLNSNRIKTFIADQSDRRQLAAFTDACGSGFDLILDDGGHSMAQQQISFACLFRNVRPGGYYVIEDVHTSLLRDYGVEPGEENSTLTMIYRFVRNGKIESKYMTEAEMQYLNLNISFSNLMSDNKGTSITCIFRKK
jgi:demethylmacrocin O-methyltransferase